MRLSEVEHREQRHGGQVTGSKIQMIEAIKTGNTTTAVRTRAMPELIVGSFAFALEVGLFKID
jgi:hypothetical protein